MSAIFSKPKTPYIPPPPTPPPEPTGAETASMEEARKKMRRRATGRAQTQLTGGRGVTGAPTLIRKKLRGE